MSDEENVPSSVIKTFTDKYNVGTVFIVTGLVLVAAFAWMQVLRPLKEVAEDVVDTVTGSS